MKCLHAYHRLPDGLTPDDVRRASEAGAHRWTAIMRDSRIARLAMGEMATEIAMPLGGGIMVAAPARAPTSEFQLAASPLMMPVKKGEIASFGGDE